MQLNGSNIYNGLSINNCEPRVASGEVLFDNVVLTSRIQYGLPDDAIVYCNFNQLYKIEPHILEVWVNILNKVPKSVLWLLSFPAAGEPNIQKYSQRLGKACLSIILVFSMNNNYNVIPDGNISENLQKGPTITLLCSCFIRVTETLDSYKVRKKFATIALCLFGVVSYKIFCGIKQSSITLLSYQLKMFACLVRFCFGTT